MKLTNKRLKKLVLYLIRWQCSTPVLALCLFLLSARMNELGATIVANFIGGLMFFFIDERIFKKE